jgi:hypothetical protein
MGQFRIAVRDEDNAERSAEKKQRKWLQRTQNLHRAPPEKDQELTKQSGILAEKQRVQRRGRSVEESGAIFAIRCGEARDLIVIFAASVPRLNNEMACASPEIELVQTSSSPHSLSQAVRQSDLPGF